MATTELLLVEDNLADILLLTESLERSGWDHRLTSLRNGAEAVAYLFRQGAHAQAVRPDLILLDMNLPLMNGDEVLAALGQDESLAAIPVFLLSGSNQAWAHLQAALPSKVFTKPMAFQGYLDLAERIRSQFQASVPGGPNPGPRAE